MHGASAQRLEVAAAPADPRRRVRGRSLGRRARGAPRGAPAERAALRATAERARPPGRRARGARQRRSAEHRERAVRAGALAQAPGGQGRRGPLDGRSRDGPVSEHRQLAAAAGARAGFGALRRSSHGAEAQRWAAAGPLLGGALSCRHRVRRTSHGASKEHVGGPKARGGLRCASHRGDEEHVGGPQTGGGRRRRLRRAGHGANEEHMGPPARGQCGQGCSERGRGRGVWRPDVGPEAVRAGIWRALHRAFEKRFCALTSAGRQPPAAGGDFRGHGSRHPGRSGGGAPPQQLDLRPLRPEAKEQFSRARFPT
mmetsp:Transcript_39578/g.123269  ORF Transcript_39578/g.123269 Transcript_39578/m.123269 type:complete len:313 (-) Transcript_39578:149-1087(-)